MSREREGAEPDLSSGIPATGMERLWSLAGATSGNRWQIGRPRKRRNQAKTVATGCDQLPWDLHGKEGVDGSSPSEGSAGFRMVAWVAGLQVAGRGAGCPVMETIWKRGESDTAPAAAWGALAGGSRSYFFGTEPPLQSGDQSETLSSVT